MLWDPAGGLLVRHTGRGHNYGATVAGLKAQPGRDLSIIGGASRVRSLHAAGLIDRYTLVICPPILVSGALLFEGPGPADRVRAHR